MTQIIYNESTLPCILDVLEEHCPLRHRELHLHATGSFPAGAKIDVCEDGHVHLYQGPLTVMQSHTLNGVMAYALALILDAKVKMPKRPSGKRVTRCASDVGKALVTIDQGLANAFGRNMDTLAGWITAYVSTNFDGPEDDEASLAESVVQGMGLDRPEPLRVPLGGDFKAVIQHTPDGPHFRRLFGSVVKPGEC
jgi:hypothetical protein